VFLRDTFELDYAVALIFNLTQPNCSVQRDEKQPITGKSLSKE
jgi:hypothetical protein